MPDSDAKSPIDALADAASDVEMAERLTWFFETVTSAFSRNTERALRADLRVFLAWCRRHGLAAMPASDATVVAFIDDMACSRAPATVRRYVSSIATLHKALGLANPKENAAVKLALQRMYRMRGRRQTQVAGMTWPLRNRLIEAAGGRLIDARNRALVAVAYDTLLRRSELVSLNVSDLVEEADGSATLLVRRSKTDPEGAGAMLFVARDTLGIVKVWLGRGAIAEGRLFRSVRKDGTVGETLDASQVPRIYKAMALNAGVPAADVVALAGHSTRVGPVQDMIACGIELPAILQAGRWKSVRMVQRYGERLLARRSGAAQLAERQRR
ncbi:tyrosine-type recombinase/integrase [Candidatus Palauibacter irciniicola]|uniref:tyrosine-type recombinase/integrase n=1 Tax=Candidatus Palauibacter irciniicola TaxID=3056733 RepID=UPI003B0110EC